MENVMFEFEQTFYCLQCDMDYMRAVCVHLFQIYTIEWRKVDLMQTQPEFILGQVDAETRCEKKHSFALFIDFIYVLSEIYYQIL